MVDLSISVLGGRIDTSDAPVLIEDLRRQISREPSGEYEWSINGPWCSVVPQGVKPRAQGWKIHLSASLGSAHQVLVRSLPILLAARCPFKFVNALVTVGRLNSRTAPRGSSGKFITVYPNNDNQAAYLAEALHGATEDLRGPRILSDQPYVPKSVVHYRYGAFLPNRRLSNDGSYQYYVQDSDGNLVIDRREPGYVAPAWAPPSPFGRQDIRDLGVESGQGGEPDGGSDTVGHAHAILLGDRFSVHGAIRHSNKGGLYQAIDISNGAAVVLKEARAQVEADAHGRDVQDMLRVEADALSALSALGIAPQPLALFSQGDSLFLAEELIPGQSLQDWVASYMHERGRFRELAAILPILERLVDLVAVVHRAGFIIRDLSPSNLMVRPDGQMQLIDLELVMQQDGEEGDPITLGTPGFASPEQMQGNHISFETDRYGLGALICFVTTGNPPYFAPEAPFSRTLYERLSEWLDVRSSVLEIPVPIRSLILGLTDIEARQRPTLSHAKSVLARVTSSHVSLQKSKDRGFEEEHWVQAVDGITSHLLGSMITKNGEQLWPLPCARGLADPCAVHYGAAGVLAVLTRCFELTHDQRILERILAASRWIAKRLDSDAERSPGLYFGTAGITWSLHEAGRILGDDAMCNLALELAMGLPVTSPNPDLTHGTAGIGLALLHLWLCTGEGELLSRARMSADAIMASVENDGNALVWATPAAYESRFAGGRYYGYAHGTAGIGDFLTAIGVVTGQRCYLDLARCAGDSLVRSAVLESPGSETIALWGPGPGDQTTAPYWCHGSAGIGSFLIRLYRAVPDERYRRAALMSGDAVLAHLWRGLPLGQCHGLAGNGEFLLDLAEYCDAGDEERFRLDDGIRQVASLIFADRVNRDGRAVFCDEEGGVSAAWSEGISGILAFFLRMKYRSSRLWYADTLSCE